MSYKPKIIYAHSQKEVAEAMRKFQRDGGLVKRLPDQDNPKRTYVEPKGLRNSPAYEDVMVDGA